MGLVRLQCIDHQQRHALMVPPAAHQWSLRTDLGLQQAILIVIEGPLPAFTAGHPFTAVVVAVLDAATILVRHRQNLAARMPAQLPAVPFQWPAGGVVGNVLVTVGACKEGGFLLAVGRFPLQRWLMHPGRGDAVATVVMAVLPLAFADGGRSDAKPLDKFLFVGGLPFDPGQTPLVVVFRELALQQGVVQAPASVLIIADAGLVQDAVE